MARSREIDGLRAIAVLAVLLAHAGVPFFSGGFVGVDIFFVISGFLITKIIVHELEEGTFSIGRFYERRARRILPALFFVVATCLIAGWVTMSADAFENLGQSVVATVLFSNNILLNLTSGYWETESSFKPLLHTWSLGVEEQYYILVPIILIIIARSSRPRFATVLSILAVFSFVTALVAQPFAPNFVFYELPTRAWELAAGGLTAVLTRRTTDLSSPSLSLLGLVMIVAGILAFPEHHPSGPLLLLLPVVGTTLVLSYCRDGLVYRVLASPPMTGVGLISYSLYLWHQPLFAYLRLVSPQKPATTAFVALIFGSVGLAVLTWKFVEQPFRDPQRLSMRSVLAMLGLTAMGLIVSGLYIYRAGGLPARFDIAPGAEPAGSYKAYNMQVYSKKRDAFEENLPGKLLVIGNSFGRDFVNMAIENKEFSDFEIVYRDDVNLCSEQSMSDTHRKLVAAATEVVVVYGGPPPAGCSGWALANRPSLAGKIIFVGPKGFGDNLNAVARLPLSQRSAARVTLSAELLAMNQNFKANFPAAISVDIIAHLSADGRTVPIFDNEGRILSEDRAHVTRSGAKFVGKLIFDDPAWDRVSATSKRISAAPHSTERGAASTIEQFQKRAVELTQRPLDIRKTD